MDVVERTKPAGAVVGWGVVGALWAVALLGISSIGVFVAPVAIIATAVAARFYGRTRALALPVAAGLTAAALLVPFLAADEGGSVNSTLPPPNFQQ